MRVCSLDGCERQHRALGYCWPHYKRLKRTGDPLGKYGSHGHGNYNDLTYKTWQSMKARCLLATSTKYPDYGARGITICDRWLGHDGFSNFMTDMGERKEGMTLDRIDVNGNYTPENCRWANTTTQSRNKRVYRNNKTGVSGVEYRQNKWRAIISSKGKKKHLGTFDTKEQAVSARLNAEKELWV